MSLCWATNTNGDDEGETFFSRVFFLLSSLLSLDSPESCFARCFLFAWFFRHPAINSSLYGSFLLTVLLKCRFVLVGQFIQYISSTSRLNIIGTNVSFFSFSLRLHHSERLLMFVHIAFGICDISSLYMCAILLFCFCGCETKHFHR